MTGTSFTEREKQRRENEGDILERRGVGLIGGAYVALLGVMFFGGALLHLLNKAKGRDL